MQDRFILIPNLSICHISQMHAIWRFAISINCAHQLFTANPSLMICNFLQLAEILIPCRFSIVYIKFAASIKLSIVPVSTQKFYIQLASFKIHSIQICYLQFASCTRRQIFRKFYTTIIVKIQTSNCII